MNILKYRDFELPSLHSNVGIGGFFRLEKFVRHNGREIITYSGPWFHNLITDVGMNFFGDELRPPGGFMESCSIGTGTATPSVLDTSLSAFLASTAGSQVHTTAGGTSANGVTVSPVSVNSIQAVSPYRASLARTWEFPPGIGTGNITEVGVSNNMVPASQKLFTRELVRDSGGAPTTIAKLEDEFLRVTYDFGTLIDLVDKTGSVVLQSISYAYTMRPALVNLLDAFGGSSGGGRTIPNNAFQEWQTMISGWGNGWTGAIGPITGIPSGTFIGDSTSTTVVNTPYSAGTFLKDASSTLSLTAGVHASGIGALKVATQYYTLQIGFVPNIPKLGTQTLTLNLRTTWART